MREGVICLIRSLGSTNFLRLKAIACKINLSNLMWYLIEERPFGLELFFKPLPIF